MHLESQCIGVQLCGHYGLLLNLSLECFSFFVVLVDNVAYLALSVANMQCSFQAEYIEPAERFVESCYKLISSCVKFIQLKIWFAGFTQIIEFWKSHII